MDKPILQSVWLPRLFLMVCLHQATMFAYVYELLPTAAMDLFFCVTGHKARLLPLYRRVWLSRQRTRHLLRRDWDIVCENIGKLYSRCVNCILISMAIYR